MAEFFVVIDELFQRSLRRQRVFLDRTNPLDSLDDIGLLMRFRFPKTEILNIIALCQDELQRETLRNSAIPVHMQVLAALRFYASGSYQQCTSDTLGLSQPSISRAISDVSRILSENIEYFVKFGNGFERRKFGFYSIASFPNVIGAVDGAHIKIQSPGGVSESLYVCRKGGYSVNVQIICDQYMFITDAVVKWPGATHDSYMWKNSDLRNKFMENPPDGYLIGDSGYCIEPWLITPFPAAQVLTAAEAKYQKSFVRTRRIVENAIGLWKNVFRCLTDNVLLYKPSKVCKIVASTVVLHNIRRRLRLPADEHFEAPVYQENESIATNDDSEVTRMGFRVRKNIIDNHFA